MTTETLKEAGRYLLNNGFRCGAEVELDNQYQARYDFGQLRGNVGITITLHDYGNERWTYMSVAYSKDFLEKSGQRTNGLRQLPGFEPHKI